MNRFEKYYLTETIMLEHKLTPDFGYGRLSVVETMHKDISITNIDDFSAYLNEPLACVYFIDTSNIVEYINYGLETSCLARISFTPHFLYYFIIQGASLQQKTWELVSELRVPLYIHDELKFFHNICALLHIVHGNIGKIYDLI